MDDSPDEFKYLQQDYDGLHYPGDLPGDLGLIPIRQAQRSGWQIGPAARWFGPMAAAAAVALIVGGTGHFFTPYVARVVIAPAVVAPAGAPIAVAPPATRPTQIAVAVPRPISDVAPVAIASTKTAKTANISAASAVDDSIPLWSDVDMSPTSLSVSAGLPSQSLILPTFSEVQAEKTSAEQVKSSQSKS